jgi:hypothetical protein
MHATGRTNQNNTSQSASIRVKAQFESPKQHKAWRKMTAGS